MPPDFSPSPDVPPAPDPLGPPPAWVTVLGVIGAACLVAHAAWLLVRMFAAR